MTLATVQIANFPFYGRHDRTDFLKRTCYESIEITLEDRSYQQRRRMTQFPRILSGEINFLSQARVFLARIHFHRY